MESDQTTIRSNVRALRNPLQTILPRSSEFVLELANAGYSFEHDVVRLKVRRPDGLRLAGGMIVEADENMTAPSAATLEATARAIVADLEPVRVRDVSERLTRVDYKVRNLSEYLRED